MIDVREYKGAIREAVRRERHDDKNWAWRVKAINKGVAKIGWEYLDWLGERDRDFLVSIEENDDFKAVIGRDPAGHRTIRLVGDSRWDDCRTIEEGIALTIHGMARYAHTVY